ncbi:putative quinol monooxygenase [Hymenobacter terrenus]|uniref:putative quinol monooxygenase n=1 Tax=Hymenobacter terrenus TaxID=1629124 RepID=UPI000619B355|nr:antibiotic biosynthesis monooxygenase [Hymenobacter terrenus]
MEKVAILVQLEAKPGKEQAVEDFLKSALPLAQAEAGTLSWYAIKMGPNKFGIFDTFADETGRQAHIAGEIAKALFAHADDLLAQPPVIDQPEILAVKPLIA